MVASTIESQLEALNARLGISEQQSQLLGQALAATQSELSQAKAQTSQPVPVNTSSGLPKGVKTQAPDRFSGRPSLAYPTTQHFLEFAARYMRVGGVAEADKTDYVTLHLLEGEARTWYDLRFKTVAFETFDSFAIALKSHFTNHNSQKHYREALYSLNMKQIKDVME